MEIYKYKDYDEYKKIQVETNKSKLARGWSYFNQPGPRKDIITEMATKYFGDSDDKDVMCHGTRGGHEQQFFKSLYPNGNTIGTEISDTATRFPMTVEWDFTKQNSEWVNGFDIVYSNSFDHTIEPQETLRVWHEQLKEGGLMFNEWSERQAIGNKNDPLKATFEEIEELIVKVGFEIVETQRIGPISGNMYVCKKI
tara:strand:- start:11497 stop:12087 length:591 start_codon:yes stop_codon:yes gene_type:complete